MRDSRLQRVLAFAAAVALGAAGGVPADDGDVTISGSLRYNAVYENAGDPQSTYEASLRHYVLEAGPSTVGTTQPLDVDVVEALCGDKDGCRITLQMTNWDPVGEPGATASRTSWLFVSPATGQWRLDEALGTKGVDDDGAYEPLWQLYDCIFGDGESGTGGVFADDAVGFGLKNCGGSTGACGFSDEHTVCRVVLRD